MKKLILIFSIMIFTVITVNAQISVIANKSVSETVNVTKVGNIYSLTATKWSDGSKIVVLDNGSNAKSDFYKGIGKDQASLKKEWMKKQLTGEAKAPESLSSDDEVLNKVASTPGAIGYVKSSSVNGTVKVLVEIK